MQRTVAHGRHKLQSGARHEQCMLTAAATLLGSAGHSVRPPWLDSLPSTPPLLTHLQVALGC